MAHIAPHSSPTLSKGNRSQCALAREDTPQAGKPIHVSEAEYWEKYYAAEQDADGNPVSYEWNNGLLEVKPVSDYATHLVYLWFFNLLQHYLRQYPEQARLTYLEMGAKLQTSPHTATVRKPDIGVVLGSNPVSLELEHRSYKGRFDMCIEALSDSNRQAKERDTVQKKAEYEQAGVQEYLILHKDLKNCLYYRLDTQGVYQPVEPDQEGVFRSQVLPGLQWRMADLITRPDWLAMSQDAVYQHFIGIEYQQEKRAREQEQQLREQEQQKREQEQRARQRAEQALENAELEIERLRALLRQSGS